MPSTESELDAVRSARIVPVDRVLAEMLAHDRAGAEFDATLGIVDELALLQAVDLRGTDVQTRLRLTRTTDVRVDRDEGLFVELELIQANAFVYAQRLGGVRFRALGHRDAVREPA